MKNDTELSDIVSNIMTIINKDVVHAGTASTIHMHAAHTNIAITRCCIPVSPSIPNTSVGNKAITRAMSEMRETLIYLL